MEPLNQENQNQAEPKRKTTKREGGRRNGRTGCVNCGPKLTRTQVTRMEANKILMGLAALAKDEAVSAQLTELAGKIDLYIQPHYYEHKWCLGVLDKESGELTDLGEITSLVS